MPHTAAMRKNAANSLLVALPSALLGGLLAATLTTTARANPPLGGEQWVYQEGVYVTSDSNDRDRVMTTWGNSGFEAYAVTVVNRVTVVYFKKPR